MYRVLDPYGNMIHRESVSVTKSFLITLAVVALHLLSYGQLSTNDKSHKKLFLTLTDPHCSTEMCTYVLPYLVRRFEVPRYGTEVRTVLVRTHGRWSYSAPSRGESCHNGVIVKLPLQDVSWSATAPTGSDLLDTRRTQPQLMRSATR